MKFFMFFGFLLLSSSVSLRAMEEKKGIKSNQSEEVHLVPSSPVMISNLVDVITKHGKFSKGNKMMVMPNKTIYTVENDEDTSNGRVVTLVRDNNSCFGIPTQRIVKTVRHVSQNPLTIETNRTVRQTPCGKGIVYASYATLALASMLSGGLITWSCDLFYQN
jgi:hypothetical protein